MARARGEAFWWAIFSAGGVVSALLVPIHIILLGIRDSVLVGTEQIRFPMTGYMRCFLIR